MKMFGDNEAVRCLSGSHVSAPIPHLIFSQMGNICFYEIIRFLWADLQLQ